jgi:transposase
MSEAIDPALLDALPVEMRAIFEAQARALADKDSALEAERLARWRMEAANSELEASNADLKAANERLEYLIAELRRARFGPRSEKLDADQLYLAFEDIETAIAEMRETVDRRHGLDKAMNVRRRRVLPMQLPRVEQVIEPDSIVCPCGCGDMIRIGEDRSERLDVTPAQFRIVVTVRPRYACAKGRAGVRQARAPVHLIEGGMPTEALIAQVIVGKYSDHLPLYRQAQIFARNNVPLSRSTLADWVGRAAFHLAPIVERMAVLIKQSGKLFMDETTAPVLDPGRGKTKTGFMWALARDERRFAGSDPPAVVFRYAPSRAGDHAETMLAGFNGVLQVDGYAGYNRLERADRKGGSPVKLAYCWAHARREVIKATPEAGSPVADDILRRVADLYAIEKQIHGCSHERRLAVRQELARPLVEELKDVIVAQRHRLSRASAMGKALGYFMNQWDGLILYLEDGRVEMDNNPVENVIRPLALNRKNSLFAGHDEGAQNWARLASLIGTCKLNGVEPFTYMKATLEAIAKGHPNVQIDALLPWNFKAPSLPSAIEASNPATAKPPRYMGS